MIQIGDTIISLDIFEKKFCCDLAVCKAVPTAEAVELAKKYRLTLICAARPDRIRVYVS